MEQLYTHKTTQILKQTSTLNINPEPFSLLVIAIRLANQTSGLFVMVESPRQHEKNEDW